MVSVDDYYATGDEIVEKIAALTPPGRENHIVGLQNIKGTGLDFVYRWQAWEQISQALELLRSDDDRAQSEGLRKMAGFQELGVLSEHDLRATFKLLRDRALDREGLFAQLDAIEARQSSSAGSPNESTTDSPSHWLSSAIFSALEGLLDAGDAIRRRKMSDRIYKDLADQRISLARAAVELKAITQRQKGGWLRKSYLDLRRRTPMPLVARGTGQPD